MREIQVVFKGFVVKYFRDNDEEQDDIRLYEQKATLVNKQKILKSLYEDEADVDAVNDEND